MSPYDTTFGLCKCGCKQRTTLALLSRADRGWIKGQPIDYILGHSGRSKLDDADRFWSYVDRSAGDDACWPWMGGTSNGYGKVRFAGKLRGAHVVAWFLTYDEWPKLYILHRCDFPACCNVKKCLFQGTHQDNMSDMLSKNRSTKGEKHGATKLTEKKVRNIRKFYAQGASQAWIAERYHVSHQLISRILRGEIWTHVDH
jgi:hypothetical protein